VLLALGIVVVAAGCGGGGGGSSLEAELSKKTKLEISDCVRDNDSIYALVPNAQAYSCKFKDEVSGKLHGYVAYVDADGKLVGGTVDPLSLLP
jgi:hypothetical protein